MFDLVIHSGKQQGKRLSLPADKPVVVGREEGCQLILNSSLVSRRHTELKSTTEGIWARDLGSQNGTYVNDVAIQEATLLIAGDILRIGALTFQIEPHVPATPPAAERPPTTASGTKRTPKKDGGLSDADIASWLNEGAPGKPGDTAVLPDLKKPVTPPPVAPPAPPAKKFRSVKDEAADIIRRHWARVRGEGE
jgi:hypothetical protein